MQDEPRTYVKPAKMAGAYWLDGNVVSVVNQCWFGEVRSQADDNVGTCQELMGASSQQEARASVS